MTTFSLLAQRSRSVIDSASVMQLKQRQQLHTPKSLFPQRSPKIQNSQGSASTPVQRSAPTAAYCYDTSGRFFLLKDSMVYWSEATTLAADGKILISGEYRINKPPYNLTGGYLMKCNDTGAVDWIQHYDSSNHIGYSYIAYYRVTELKDGSILMAGITPNDVSDNDDIILTRVDNAGNIIWSQTYNSRFWTRGRGSADYFYIQELKQDPFTTDVYLTATHWALGENVTRLRVDDGGIIWSNVYNVWGDFHRPFGMDIKENELISFTRYAGGALNFIRINKATGDTIATKFFGTVDPSFFNLGFLSPEGVTKLDNGNYALFGRLYRYYYALNDSITPLHHVGVAEFDSNLEFVQATAYTNNVVSNSYNTKISVFADGSGAYSMLKPIPGWGDSADVYYIQFRNGQILRQRIREYRNEGLPLENEALRLRDGSDLFIKTIGDNITFRHKVEFLNLHLADTSSYCLGRDVVNNFAKPYRFQSFSSNLRSVETNDLRLSINKTISKFPLDLTKIPACRNISYCDTLSLVPSADTLCENIPFTLVFRKNKACGSGLFLNFDTNFVKSYRPLNDSAFEIKFKSIGTTKLSGSILGCKLLTDSLSITVLRSPGMIGLGADTVICPGNTIRIAAKPGYAGYRWQDGSTDSIFIASQPGIYNVEATDSCGNLFRDTLEVAPHPPIPFDLGADIRICERDTATITAPPAFFNYRWLPDYNINSISSQSVRVSPRQDTLYYVAAEKTAGCFVYDSIKVFVNRAPAINLGADRSFCTGDSAVLDAGPGFSQYSWNNGSSQQRLVAYRSGLYTITGITAQGCRSADSLRIHSVFANPVVNLGIDSVVCDGTIRTLDAGNFQSYSWNTGSVNRTMPISQTGIYSVIVSDNNNCKGADTIAINTKIIPPAGFLAPDTSICSYGKLILSSNDIYSAYRWNTNDNNASITISKAGLYWLEVEDEYRCKGRDSILIALKDCLKGFYIPTAFTPNSDGKNDLFRPLIFGTLVKYEFTIFNRWGQMVFRSSDYSKGWNGMIGGSIQLNGGFAWVCTYQFEGEKTVTEKGTVLLIR
ncbi:MAG: gliding motility-associated C-terminal domain-containing protein [Chitinophagaceae bacterium]|nr:gliding motility-associated C-terminal domain-containing protein [Chitinophagaceae bacterium]